MDVTDLLERVSAGLRAYGISVEVRDIDSDRLDSVTDETASIRLSRGSTSATFRAVMMSKPNLTALLHEVRNYEPYNTVLITPHLNPRTASTLRRAGIQYVDAAGNTMLEFGDVYVRVEGRRPDGGSRASHDRFATETSNLFSPRRAQVIMALISWPELANESVRAIAECAGTSVGIAQSTITLLRKIDLEPHRRPRDHDRLIDMWVASYPEGLGRTLALGSFAGEPGPYGLDPADTHVWISGEALAPRITGQRTLTLYVEEFNPQLAVKNRWQRSQSPNIFVRRKFWNTPGTGFEASLLTPPPVPPLVAYADMMAINDQRVRVAAEEYRETYRGLADTQPS